MEDGFFTDTYEVIYEAKLSGDVWEAVDALSALEGEFPGSAAEWAFVEKAIVLELTYDAYDVNFTAVLLGDVSGNWTSDPAEELE